MKKFKRVSSMEGKRFYRCEEDGKIYSEEQMRVALRESRETLEVVSNDAPVQKKKSKKKKKTSKKKKD